MAPLRDSVQEQRLLRFGNFEADLRTLELRKFGLRLNLQRQPFQVLAALLERPGDIVTRQELQQRIWPEDTFVHFDLGLNKAIAKLRAALNDDPANPRYIETVPRVGYRFLYPITTTISSQVSLSGAAVSTVQNGGGRLPDASQVERVSPISPAAPNRFAHTRLRLALLVVLAIAVAAGAVLAIRWWPARNPGYHFRSIAVLPLENLSGDPSENYFAEGITDELITNLAKIKSLHVRSFTSVIRYENQHKSSSDIARELSVDALVEGSVTKVGDRIRITVQLTEPVEGSVLWVKSYDTDLRDVITAETDLAKMIGREVHANFDPSEEQFLARTSHPLVPAAYLSYLKGHYLFHKQQLNRNDIQQSCSAFQSAIAADAAFSPAYAGMAQCLQWQETRRYISHEESNAESFALKAVELDPQSSKAHAILGSIYFYHEWNWPGAEQQLKQAIELNPNEAEVHSLYAEYLKVMGRLPEALDEIRRAQQLDPLEFYYFLSSGYYLLYMHRYDEAEVDFNKVLQVIPDNISALTGMAEAYEKKGDLERAAECWQKYETAEDQKPDVAPFMESYRKRGFHAAKQEYLEARVQLGEKQFRRGGEWEKLNLAYLNAMLDRRKQALGFLELAYQSHMTPLINLKIDSRFDRLRNDPEFKDLLKRMKLADQ